MGNKVALANSWNVQVCNATSLLSRLCYRVDVTYSSDDLIRHLRTAGGFNIGVCDARMLPLMRLSRSDSVCR